MTQNAPERVWIQNDTKDQRALLAEYAEAPHPDVIDSFPQYVRADLHEALAAEVIALRKRVEAADAMADAMKWSEMVIENIRNGRGFSMLESKDCLAACREALAAYRATVTP